VVDKMRHALAAALAVPVLWVSTVTFGIMGVVYSLAIVALASIERVVRRPTDRRWSAPTRHARSRRCSRRRMPRWSRIPLS